MVEEIQKKHIDPFKNSAVSSAFNNTWKIVTLC